MRFAVPICTVFVLQAVLANAQFQESLPAQSHTGQFSAQSTRSVVLPGRTPQLAPRRVPAGDAWFFLLRSQASARQHNPSMTLLTLEPAVTVVACERIKSQVLRELGMSDQWRHKIHVRIEPRFREEDIALTIAPHPSGRMYVLQVPEEVTEAVLHRSVTVALLFELAHRQGGGRAASLPRWLADGFAAYLQSSGAPALSPQDNRSYHLNVRPNSTAELHGRLQRNPPLTFDEFSWSETVPPGRADGFEDSAHMLVRELLRLRQGRASFREFVENLGRYENWQFAFFEAFSGHFQRPLDVEKWWALNVVATTGRDPAHFWPREQTLERLQEALRIPIQVHTAAGRMPQRSTFTLQEAIDQWEYPRQKHALQGVITQLRLLRIRAPMDVVGIIDEYRSVLEEYLGQRDVAGQAPSRRGDPSVNVNVARQTALRELERLDHQLALMVAPPAETPLISNHP